MVDIDEIYDAAFDRERFPALLRKIIQAMGAQCGFLAWVDMAEETRFETEFGNDPAFLQSYMTTYGELDLMRPTLQAADEGVIMQAFSHLQTPEVRKSRFYKEWLAPQEIVDNLAVNLIKREQMFAPMAIIRTGDAPPFSADDVARLEALVPHLKRAIYMQARLIHQANLVSGYRRITSGARNGVILLDARLRVLDLDPSIGTLTGLKVGQTAGAATAFEGAVLQTVRDDAPVAIAVAGDEGDPVTLLCVAQTLRRDPFGDLTADGAAHAVHVMRVDHGSPVAFASMAELYSLTPTELRVLADAFAHGDLTMLGERLGMAKATARTHLHRIYDKTQTQGFAALCLLAHRFALPG